MKFVSCHEFHINLPVAAAGVLRLLKRNGRGNEPETHQSVDGKLEDSPFSSKSPVMSIVIVFFAAFPVDLE